MTIAPYREFSNQMLVRFRVKGDGSGALFAVQLETPREFGKRLSHHCVLLDFTGWRTYEMSFRENDTETYQDYKWPVFNYHAWTGGIITAKKFSALHFLVNGLPADRAVTVEVSDVALVPQGAHLVSAPKLVLNGRTHAVPFVLRSGEYAEFEDGAWTRYNMI